MEKEKMSLLEDRKEASEFLSSGHDILVVLLNSQQLKMLTQVQASKNMSMMGEKGSQGPDGNCGVIGH